MGAGRRGSGINFIKSISEKVKEISREFDGVKIMHLCGTHENTITKFGLRQLLPENVSLLSGPGCPVCITPDEDIQMAMHLLKRKKITLTTFGDMARVPFKGKSLLTLRSEGYDVRVVYSVFDALEIAKASEKPVVHFAIGFETTMPSTALAILDEPDNFFVFSAHRFFIPAVHALYENTAIDAFIDPGHVSTIVGVKPYEEVLEKYGIPQVIAGFEPGDVMLAVYMLLKILKEGEKRVVNEYTRAVRYEGNKRAVKAMSNVFRVEDGKWRGLGIVKNSGAEIAKRFEDFDAKKVFEDVFEDFQPEEDKTKSSCRCGEVLKGVLKPSDCPLFLKACIPRNPVGPCMVGVEGTCNIWATFGTMQRLGKDTSSCKNR